MRQLTLSDAEALVMGGTILGGGGGGDRDEGLKFARLALETGDVMLVHPDALSDDDLIITCSGVGAPAATERAVAPRDYINAVQLLLEHCPVPPGGLNASENGGFNSVNGWFQAAVLGIPVVDAPANGRAHPTGIMGAMGLEDEPGYISRQAACGGSRKDGRYIKVYAEGSLSAAAAVVRSAAVAAGGLVAVARNPVSAKYVRSHGAPGALSQAIDMGRAFIAQVERGGPDAAVAVLEEHLGAVVLARGAVRDFDLVTEGGFDVGRCHIGEVAVTFWNEYMTVDAGGQRLATFPQLITTLDAGSGLPLTTAQLADGHEVILISAPLDRLILGSGVRKRANLARIEQVVGRDIIRFLPEELFL